MSELKSSISIPKGATHWSPKSEFSKECFYKKTSVGVSVYVVDDSDDRCNRWDSSLGNGHVEVVNCMPVRMIGMESQLEQVTKERDEALELLRCCQDYVKDVPVLRVSVKEVLAKLNQ